MTHSTRNPTSAVIVVASLGSLLLVGIPLFQKLQSSAEDDRRPSAVSESPLGPQGNVVAAQPAPDVTARERSSRGLVRMTTVAASADGQALTRGVIDCAWIEGESVAQWARRASELTHYDTQEGRVHPLADLFGPGVGTLAFLADWKAEDDREVELLLLMDPGIGEDAALEEYTSVLQSFQSEMPVRVRTRPVHAGDLYLRTRAAMEGENR